MLKTRFIAAVTNYLSDKYKLKIESAHQKQDAPADGQYPIIVKLAHNPAADYRLILHGGTHGRSHVMKLRGHIYELGQEEEGEKWVPDVYLAHEAAHLILGENDEYAIGHGILVYKDNSLMGHFYVEGIKKAEIKARHFQFLVPLLKGWFPDRTIKVVPETRGAGHLG
ncbi:MAG: hypothetical protein ACPGWR_13835 [Ardenticatenaceae bacterium]